MQNKPELIEMTVSIVSAYVGGNSVAADELPSIVETVYSTLRDLSVRPEGGNGNDLTPAVPIKKSITPEFIICLEDGKKFKSLKRHLRTRYGMSPEEYRARWGLPHDYPMVAPNYAKQRSDLAKRTGLGTFRGKPTDDDDDGDDE